MIHHISLAAHDTQKVGKTLAEIIGGKLFPAPPNFPAGSLFLIPGDEHGTMFEILPFGTEMRPDEAEAGFHTDAPPNSKYVAAHAYISVEMPAEKILAIGAREGWLTRVCDRGPFDLVECWIENRQLIEFAAPEMKAKYLALFNNPAALQALATAQ